MTADIRSYRLTEELGRRRFTRELAALIEKIDDPESFAIAVELLDTAVNQLPAAAARIRDTQPNGLPGYSWQNIADALGTSRQTIWNRFNRAGQSRPRVIATRTPKE